MSGIWASYAEDWALAHKVTFDGSARIIRVNAGESALSVKEDIYSAWKEWSRVRDHLKFAQAMRVIGGDPVGGGLYAGDIYFLMNGWRVLIEHVVSVVGTLYHDDGISPYWVTSGGVSATVSNLAYGVGTSGSGGLTEAQDAQLAQIGDVLAGVQGNAAALASVDAGIGALISAMAELDTDSGALADQVAAILKLTGNRVSKSGDLVTIYENDGVTVFRRYNLANGGRVPV